MVVTKESMNYASVVFVGFVAIAAVWYGVWGYHNYRGPPTDAVEPDGASSRPASPPTYAEVPDKVRDT
jgi:hypothetical protein